MTRGELVEALRLHRGEIVEADEWRPLADHVLELVERGFLRPTPPKGSEIEKAREFLATMLQNDSTERAALAAFDALAREPKLREHLAEVERLKEVWRSCSFNNETFFREFEERVRAVIKALRQETPTAAMQDACYRLEATFYHNLKAPA